MIAVGRFRPAPNVSADCAVRQFVLVAFSTLLLAHSQVRSDDDEQFFEARVRPILSERCWECHGDKKQESGLRLDSREAVLKGGDSASPIFDANSPDQSLMLRAVRHQGDLQMPPDRPLPGEEVEILSQWLARGLPWSKTVGPTAAKSISDRVADDRRTHWAFQPIARPPMPSVSRSDWPANPIDPFILQGLDAVELSPSPPASDRYLHRRLAFDLIGLPPAAADVSEFESDDRPDKVERLVDRQLASPRYGERWGRHWLDLARYADTKGYAFDKDRRYPFSYTYRDYVIRSWNSDLPFHEFLKQQLAADLLPTRTEPTTVAALGFLTTGRKFNNAQDDIDDKIDLVCRGLMGLTVACARCHDHKYDAVPMDDYYSLYGVFASCHEPAELPLIGSSTESAEFAKFQQELDAINQKMEQFLSDHHTAIAQEAREKAGDYLTKVLTKLPDEDLSQFSFYQSGKAPLRRKLIDRWQAYLQKHAQLDEPVWGIWNELAALADSDTDSAFAEQARAVLARRLTEDSNSPLNRLVREAFATETLASRADLARVYGRLLASALQAWTNAGGNAEAQAKLELPQQQLLAVLFGGESAIEIPRDEVKGLLNRAERSKQTEIGKQIDALQATSPGAPPRAMVLTENEQPHNPQVFIRGNANRPGKQVPRQFLELLTGTSRTPFTQGSGRLELATAIVAPENPLTRRVLVNRIWMHHFVEPIVLTPSDWGIRCEQPPLAPLIDYLAERLLERQWSMKQLHRQLVLSSTYRQASEDRTDGRGIDVENRRFWRMNRRRLEFEALRDSLLQVSGQVNLAMGGRSVELTKPPFTTRRSVYGYIDRQDLPNLFRVFDIASPDQSNERRPRTTVPQQALFLMNSPFVGEQAARLAQQVPTSQVTAAIEEIYSDILGRAPQPDELVLATQFVESHVAPASAWQELALTLLETNEFMFVD